MGLSAAATAAIAQAATTAASVGASFGGSYTSAKKSYKYYQKAFNLENERQDYLLENQQQIAKNALRRAGYSTADPNGTGVSPAQTASMQGATVQTPDVSAIGQAAMMAAQIRNLNAQTQKTESETDYQLMYNDLYQIYGEPQMKSALENLNADTKLKVAQEIYNMNNADAVKNLTEANIKNIEQRLDMDWQKLPKELQLLSAQAYEAQEKGNLSHAEISKVWQDIKESQQRIVNLQHEVNLTDAQVAVAYALTSVYAAQEGNIKVDTNGKVIENSLNRLNKDIQEGLGVGWHQAAQILSSLIPFAGASVLLNRGK